MAFKFYEMDPRWDVKAPDSSNKGSFRGLNTNVVGITIMALYLVFQWLSVFPQCSVLNKMAAILSKTIGILHKIATILFGFPMVWV